MTTDFVSRTGLTNSRSYSPGYGSSYPLDYYWGQDDTTDISRVYFLDMHSDFDADKQQPKPTDACDFDEHVDLDAVKIHNVFEPSKDKLINVDYLRKLEEIDTDYIADYIRQVVYTIRKKTGEGTTAQYRKDNAFQPIYTDSEDNSITDFSELCCVDDSTHYTAEEYTRAQQQINYVIKMLHILGAYWRIHGLTLVRAFYMASKKIQSMQQQGSSRKVKKNDLLPYGIYTCDAKGDALSQVFITNKSEKYAAAFEWLVDEESTVCMRHRECISEFIYYCNVLNYDFENDDLTKFTAESIQSLPVICLTPNEKFNDVVYRALAGKSTDSDTQIEVMVTKQLKDVMQKIAMLSDAVEVSENLSMEGIRRNSSAELFVQESCLALINIATARSSVYVDLQELTITDGVYYYKGYPLVIELNFLRKERSILCKDTYLVSPLGFAIEVSASKKLCYCSVTALIDTYVKLCKNEITRNNCPDWAVEGI